MGLLFSAIPPTLDLVGGNTATGEMKGAPYGQGAGGKGVGAAIASTAW
jgi:hypothetical protein